MKKISTKQKISLITFGLFLCVILLEGGLRIGGFLYISLQEYRNIKSLKQKGEYRILCLGESTTAYQWPRPLEDVLNQSNVGVKFSVIDKGVIGTNTGAIVTHLKRYIDKYKPHMVVTMMGINDSGHSFVLPYKPDKVSFKTLRIYKLLRLLKLYISEKFKERSSSCDKERELSNITNRKTIKETGDLKLEKEDEKKIGKDDLCKGEHITLGRFCRDQEKLDKAEAVFKEAIKINPENEWGYIGLGRCYRGQGRFNKGEVVLKKAIEINPENEKGYIELGWYYRDRGSLDKAEAVFKKAIKTNPENEDGYIGLGSCYRGREKFNKAEVAYKKAIKTNPENEDGYIGLGGYYRDREKFNKAEAVFKKAIKINPENEGGYAGLGWCYKDRGRLDKAEAMFKDVIKINPENKEAIHYLTLCKQDQNVLNHQRENTDKPLFGFNSLNTVTNYRKLKGIVTRRNIQLVCVQYPMRSVEPLKKMFKNREGMFFVDNEGVFIEALKGVSHKEYFTDMFAGDFGHCTFKGNQLLAKNIADTILEECFNKKVK